MAAPVAARGRRGVGLRANGSASTLYHLAVNQRLAVNTADNATMRGTGLDGGLAVRLAVPHSRPWPTSLGEEEGRGMVHIQVVAARTTWEVGHPSGATISINFTTHWTWAL